jgi:O-antigen ligase
MRDWAADLPQDRLSAALMLVATWAVGLIPASMWLFNRISPVHVGVAAVAALACAAREGWLRDAAARGLAILGRPLAVLLAVFLVWCLAAASWAPRPAASLRDYGEFAGTLLGGLVLIAVWAPRAPRLIWPLLAASMLVGLAGTAYELWTGTALRRQFGFRTGGFIFNRGLVTTVLLLMPVALWFWLSGRRVFALVLIALTAGVALSSESGAAALGVVVAGAAVAGILLLPRLGWMLGGALVAALLVIAPVAGPLAERLLGQGFYETMPTGHARERVLIWLAFHEVVTDKPLAGHGFAAAPSLSGLVIGEGERARALAAQRASHTHNAPLQIAVELGLIGGTMVLMLCLLILRQIRAVGTPRASVGFAAFMVVFAIASVSHGAWQGWWWAGIGVLVALFVTLGGHLKQESAGDA